VSIRALTTQIVEADQELEQLAKADATCRRLMTAPGVGAVTAVRFVAAVDQVGRFRDAHELESYLGLMPGEDSSSDRQRRTSITKAGSAKMRWALVQACWTARRCRRQDPMVQWCEQVEKRRASGSRRRPMGSDSVVLAWVDGTRSSRPSGRPRQRPGRDPGQPVMTRGVAAGGLGLASGGLAVGLTAYQGVTIAVSAGALATSHWYVWRRGSGGRWTRGVLVLATLAAPILWWKAIAH
jgi:hypothetical protein